MDPDRVGVCREAARRCRKKALSAGDPREWIRLAEQWEGLARGVSEEALAGFSRRQPSASFRVGV
jgi:hypothetical protein